MSQELQQLLGPLILLPLMFVVGLQLVPDDFRRVFAAPRAVVGGTLGQLLLLPLMTWAVVVVLEVPPVFAAGALLLAATPGAGMSNVMAAVAGADVALSVTLTAVSSLLAVVTLPALAAVGIRFFIGDALEVEVPVGAMVQQLVTYLASPIGLGMWVRARRPEASKRYVSVANRAAVVGVLVLTAMGALAGGSSLPGGSEFFVAALAALLWTVFAMALGFGMGSILALDRDQRFTFVIEFSARNLALTIIIAVAALGRLDMGLFAGVYGATGFVLILLVAVLRGRLKAR
ncbi:MAG: bile acid:sodium symporter [Myxococcota bacterium]